MMLCLVKGRGGGGGGRRDGLLPAAAVTCEVMTVLYYVPRYML